MRQGRGSEARNLARAAAEIARLDELIPPYDGEETPEQAAARQSILKEAVFEQAVKVARALNGQGEMPPLYAEMAAAYGWKEGG